RELAGLQARLRDAQIKLGASRLKSAAAAPPAALDALIEKEVDADPLVQRRHEALATLEEGIAQIDRFAANPNHPLRQERQRQLDAARGVLEKTREARRQVVAARIRKGLEAEGLLRSREVEEEIKILDKQREALQAEAVNLGREVDRVGLSSVDLELKR